MDILIKEGVVSSREFGDLFSYWFELLGEIPNTEDQIVRMSDRRRQALWTYIRRYRFDGVIRLFRRYGRAGPVERDPAMEHFVARISSPRLDALPAASPAAV
jgi:hypothetical protein